MDPIEGILKVIISLSSFPEEGSSIAGSLLSLFELF